MDLDIWFFNTNNVYAKIKPISEVKNGKVL